MKLDLLIGLGGCLGSICRSRLGGWVLLHTADWRFPLGTFLVNLLGCLFIGLIAGLASRQGLLSMELRAFLITGFTGGFTTFSAFAAESTGLMRRGEAPVALLYILLSIALGCLLVWLGLKLASPAGPSLP